MIMDLKLQLSRNLASTTSNSLRVFQGLPISCPWVPYVTSYPSPHIIKEKLRLFKEKYRQNKKEAVPIPSTSKDTPASTQPISNASNIPSPSHFYYFLQLMQIFPETHPATIHTVLVLSKHDFFAAVDMLIYAQKCKNEIESKRFAMGRSRGIGRGVCVPISRGRGRAIRYQPLRQNIVNFREPSQNSEEPMMMPQSVETSNIVNLCNQESFGINSQEFVPDNSFLQNTSFYGQPFVNDVPLYDVQGEFSSNIINMAGFSEENMTQNGGAGTEQPVIVVESADKSVEFCETFSSL